MGHVPNPTFHRKLCATCVSVMNPVARFMPCAVLPGYTTSLDLNQGLRNMKTMPHEGNTVDYLGESEYRKHVSYCQHRLGRRHGPWAHCPSRLSRKGFADTPGASTTGVSFSTGRRSLDSSEFNADPGKRELNPQLSLIRQFSIHSK